MSVATIGDTVCLWSNQEIGIIKFIGQIEGKIGIYYGIALNQACGTNNGSMNDKPYFKTRENHGIFVKKDAFKITTKNANILRVSVGDIVRIKKFKCNGIIRYIGNTLFKADIIWYGIQLEQGKGKNNGTIDGFKYFECPPKYGIFVQSNKIEITRENNNNKKQKKKNNNHKPKFFQKRKRKKFKIKITKPMNGKYKTDDLKLDINDYPITRYFDRIKLLISGYNIIYDIPDEIGQIIFKYYFINRYILIEFSKNAKKPTFKHSWIRSEIKVPFPKQCQFQFDDTKCPNTKCKSDEGLTFIAGYQRDEKKIFEYENDIILYINEYHCFQCNRYIRHNMIQYFYKGIDCWGISKGLNKWYSVWIKPGPPKPMHIYMFLDKIGQCHECKEDTFLMDRYRRKHDIEWRIRYCPNCHLIHRDRYKNPDIDDSPYSEHNNWGLPKGWTVHESSTQIGRLYFINHRTGKSQWEDPRPLPLGFTVCTSRKRDRGKIYYANKYQKKTSWKDPRPTIYL